MMNTNLTNKLYVGPLTEPCWLKPVKAFFEAAREAQEKAEGISSMLPRDDAYFTKLLAGETGTLVVAIEGGAIKAMGALVLPGTLSDACAAGYVTAPNPHELLDLPMHERIGVVSTFCSLCTNVKQELADAAVPEAASVAKKKFSQLVLEEITKQAQSRGLAHLVAQVRQDTMKSWMRFMKSGFGLYAGFTPADGKPRFLLSSPAERMFGGVPDAELSELHERADRLSADTFLPLLAGSQKIKFAGPSERAGRIKFVFG